jgi:FtsP/CotA-like multicopper oxidase with cupredoxin domain/fibronectin type 3 domain-containing protein
MKRKDLTRRQFLLGAGLTGALLVTNGSRLRLDAAMTPTHAGGSTAGLLQDPDVPVVEDGVQPPVRPTPRRYTQADRQAAADRAKAKGFRRTELGKGYLLPPGSAPHYFSHPNYANSPLPTVDPISGLVTGGGIRKFIDGLPGLGAANANNLNQFIPVAVKDTTTYPDADYYEIAVVQYEEKMHTDLPATLLRGYVQLSTTVVPGDQVALKNVLRDGSLVDTGYFGVTAPHYLGPAIVATKDRPVRILFRNLLPAGVEGNLFFPCDTSVMGAGMGPALNGMPEVDPQHPLAGEIDPTYGKNPDCYAENRAVPHLHGATSPWISDGTPHQWITPADQFTNLPKGVSVSYVPDMWYDANGLQVPAGTPGAQNNPGPGAMTIFYTNQQSARLLFYHDHAWGITRLNVYAGEAAPYVITDDMEAALVNGGYIPPAEDTIPLVIQDKTFVPSLAQLEVSDEGWDSARWGDEGDLWVPHVYVPAQNPGDTSGVNQFGRWAYGPWFWPPTSNILYGPIANPYFDVNCDPDLGWCEPPEMPGTPYISMGMEAFNDTPLVNGTVYPTVTLKPKAYRFRILNAANDRFFNLSLYKADPAALTEVQLNPTEVAAALADPTVHPTPVAGTEGPSWIQIGTEGGFLPAPVVIPAQPITWVNDPTVFNAGNVDQHSLLLGCAERADVIVDFSQFAGQTLILYNDSPAAFPARDPRYDYYTGNGDYRDTGGAPSTVAGYGPNIRTVMQIVVEATPVGPIWDDPLTTADPLGNLQTAFKAESLGGIGVFKNSQHPIIVGQGAYNSAYGSAFKINGPRDGCARITDFSLRFNTLLNQGTTGLMTIPFQTKAIQDEMGEAFDHDYGRMSGNLGLEVPLVPGTAQNLILYPYVNPMSELINGTNLPKANVTVTPISVATDGTQIWKITHNGVDTHPIHVHLFDAQLLNRVGWDGIIRKPDLNELGWKETIRVSPLEDTIVALRPVIPQAPWELPNSVRPLNPAMPLHSTIGFNSIDAAGNPTGPIMNEMTNFGYEYVWHCHILNHEEMDMMRPISLAVPPAAPTNLAGTILGGCDNRRVVLTWTNNALNATSLTVRRATASTGPWTDLATLAADVATYTDTIGNVNQAYWYQVVATNVVGYSGTAGYSTLTVTGASVPKQFGTVYTSAPAAPTGLILTQQSGPRVLLTWTDNATNESCFRITRSVNNATFVDLAIVGAAGGTGSVSYTDTTVAMGNSYRYRVFAVNPFASSAASNTATINLLAAPAAPSSVVATGQIVSAFNARVTLTWVDNATNESGYQVQRASNAAFTGATTTNLGANVTTFQVGTLARNTPYYFRVRATNAAGNSAWVNASPFPITTP